MKKRLLIFTLLALVFMCTKNVYAFDSSNYKNRGLCGNFEVASFDSNGSINKVACYGSYNEAKTFMKNNGSNNLAIMTKVGGVTKIIDANVALLDLSVNPETLTYFYTNSNLTGSSYTYMDTGSLYGGVDGVLIDSNYTSNGVWAAKVRIGNFTGWIGQSTYEVVPITWVKSSSSYTVTNSDIRHNYVAKIQNTYSGSAGRTIGPKPDMLSVGTYYSFDGHYFYRDLTTLIKDARNGNYNNAVNKNNPYYNYYMYLSNHTRTAYSSTNIDEYIRNNMGYTKNVYGNAASSGTSRLYGSGAFFYYAQEKYGVNAVLSLSLSRNETGNGTSNLAINKNNGFGLNAVDSNPTQAANWYATFASSILGYASKWITYGYAHPRDWRYFGPQFGDKWIGMNVKYASDTYWSEKMASNYYSLDKALGMQDYNYYQLGVVNGPTIAYQSPNTSSRQIYTYPEREDALVIVNEVTSGGIKWYKVVSDLNIDSNYNEKTSGNYNWNAYVYVKASDVRKINTGKKGNISPNSVYAYQDKNYTYDLYDANATFSPKVAITTKDTPYYYNPTLSTRTGKTLLKDRYVMVYAAAFNNGVPVAYLVTSDYWYDQREWVSADSIRFTNNSYGKVSVTVSGNQYTWVNYNTDDARYSLISGLYTNSYVPVLESKVVGSNTWYKVPVNLTGTTNVYGYTLASAPGVSITLSQSVQTNTAPVINASDKSIYVGDSFDPKANVTASDAEDGNITNKIVVTENTVNVNVAGTYKVTYSVTDSNNNTVTKSINVVVKENNAPVINASDNTIYVGDSFDPKAGVTASDVEDGDLTNKIVVTENTVNTEVKGTYKVVYSVTDSKNKTTTKEITIEVIERVTINTDDLDLDDFDLDDLGITERESNFYFDYLKEVNGKLELKGYNSIKGIDNTLDKDIVYVLAFESLNSDDVYAIMMDRITNKSEMTRPVYSTDGRDYTYSWFKGEVDVTDIPDGDYRIYIFSISEDSYSYSIINNKILKPQIASYKGSKYITTRNNYLDNDLALELIVRSEQIGNKTADSIYNSYNQYRTLEFTNDKLHIKGTAYSYGMNLSISSMVDRKIIFENTTTYDKYTYNLGSITNGLYKVGTTLGDNLDKTRAWFDTEIDITNIPKGNYAIYISNVANISDYGELNELLGKDISNVILEKDNKTYSFEVNNSNRYRIELNVE